MDSTILIAIIGTAGIIMAAIIGAASKFVEIWYTNRLEKRKKLAKAPLIEVAKFSMGVDQVLFEIMNKTKASRVLLARFHNGGQFINNIPMDKFSVSNEIASCPQEPKIGPMLQNILLSTHSSIMYELLFNGQYFRDDVKDVSIDMRKSLESSKVKSLYMFLIKDINNSPIGFIEVTFHGEKKKLNDEEIAFILAKHNSILNYMSHTKQQKEEDED